MMGCTPGQSGLPGNLGKGRGAADGGNDFDDPQSPFQRLISSWDGGVVSLNETSKKTYLTE
jgi:hypothetical protein